MKLRGSHWPEADALFHRDPRWLGGDDAYSVVLGPHRTLWLFGDTFVGDGTNPDRVDAAFVRNSVAIMDGDDPARSAIRFCWGEADGAPASLFEVAPPNWLWPLHGVRLGARLLLFFMLVRPTEPGRTGSIQDWREQGPLGFFDVFGWTAALIDNPDDEPESWRWRYAAPIEESAIVLGAALHVEGDAMFLYGWDRERRVFLARCPVADAERGDFGELSWWSGGAWDAGAPSPVVESGSTEFTVHRHNGRLVMTSVVDGSVAVRFAGAPEGPWSEPVPVFAPEEAARADAFVYAGKAHPQLRGADLVATYATIGSADLTLKDDSLYCPRFVRISIEGAP